MHKQFASRSCRVYAMKQHRRLPAATVSTPLEDYLSKKRKYCAHKSTNKGTAFVTSSCCMPMRTAHELWDFVSVLYIISGIHWLVEFLPVWDASTKASGHSLTHSRQKCWVQWHIPWLPIPQWYSLFITSFQVSKRKPCGSHWVVRSWFILWGKIFYY